MQVVLPPASPSSSDDEEAEGDKHDIYTVREELVVAGQSHRNGCREVERLKECLATIETALGATDGVATDARVANVATRTKLADELNFFVSFMQVLFVLTLNLCISQRFKSSSALSWLKRWIFAGPMRSWPTDWWK
jgi:hypothetical protein